jgi:hypothetical protein
MPMPRAPKPDPINTYLASVRTFLQVLPDTDVDDMLAEIREHLSTSTEALIELGWDPAVAPSEAVRRFGPAPRIGRRLIEKYPYAWAWQRDRYGIAIAPQMPVWVAFGMMLTVWLLKPTAGSPIICVILGLIGIVTGAAGQLFSHIKSAYANHGDDNVREAIKIAKGLQNRKHRLLRLTGLERMEIGMRIALRYPSTTTDHSAWFDTAIKVVFVFPILVLIPSTHIWWTAALSYYIADTIASLVTQHTIKRLTKRHASQ